MEYITFAWQFYVPCACFRGSSRIVLPSSLFLECLPDSGDVHDHCGLTHTNIVVRPEETGTPEANCMRIICPADGKRLSGKTLVWVQHMLLSDNPFHITATFGLKYKHLPENNLHKNLQQFLCNMTSPADFQDFVRLCLYFFSLLTARLRVTEIFACVVPSTCAACCCVIPSP